MVFLTTPWLDRQRIDLTLAATLREIGEYKGRAERVGVRVLQGMESLRLVTAEHSAVAAGRLEKSDTSVGVSLFLPVCFDFFNRRTALKSYLCNHKHIQQ